MEGLWDALRKLAGNTVAALHGPVMEACEEAKSDGANLFQVLAPVLAAPVSAAMTHCRCDTEGTAVAWGMLEPHHVGVSAGAPRMFVAG